VVHLSNADGTVMTGELTNNILFGTMRASLIETPAQGTISGTNNWMATGADAAGLAATAFAASPGFTNAGNKDYTLATGSTAVGHAAQNANAPTKEYYQNETVTRMYRVRASANDIGAFESTTTGPGIGPGSAPPDGGGTGGTSGSGGMGGVTGSGGTNGTTPQGSTENGCGCAVGEAARPVGGVALLLALVMIIRRKISR
jgi:MYXO-CTERM domain-containing protein